MIALLLGASASPRSLTVTVFYDENGNGRRDPGERVLLQGVGVEVGGRDVSTEPGTGRALFVGLDEGASEVTLCPETLPPFFRSGPVTVGGAASEVSVPVTLPIGSNTPNTYLAFGDSITAGEGSRDGSGYRRKLEASLKRFFGEARVIADGVSGATTDRGVRRIRESLARARPAYTLVMLGTNDWDEADDPRARAAGSLDNLRSILRRVREANSLPLIATVIPPNVGFDWRVPPEREAWVSLLNSEIPRLATSEGAVLVDLGAAFRAHAQPRALFADHLHPNMVGYDLIAQVIFQAITTRSEANP